VTRIAKEETISEPQTIRAGFELLSEVELAILMEVETRTLLAWRAEKKGPDYVKLGKSVFYRRRDVRDWIDANVVVVRRA
jgi:predicted DNA-binding transcriptional regulator AlpA